MAPESPLPGRGQWARDRSAISSALHLVVSDCESGMTTPGCVCVCGGGGVGGDPEFLHADTQLSGFRVSLLVPKL